MREINNQIGERIYQLRIQKGYTREQLAEMADISPTFLREIEKGQKGFSVDVLYRLCNVLSVDSTYLLTGEKTTEESGFVKSMKQFDEDQINQIGNILTEISNLLEGKQG